MLTDLSRKPQVSVLVVNDLHLADKPPLGRREGYREEGLAMLSEVIAIARERHSQCIVFSGDFFHIKRPQHVSHRLVQECIDLLRRSPCEVHVVPGNHDVTERGLASLPSQPLGVLEKAGVIRIATGRYVYYSNLMIVARPYDTARDADPTYYALTDQERQIIDTKVTLMVAHGSIIPDGEYRPYPTVRVSDIDLTGIDVLCSGHIHEDLGIHTVPRPGRTGATLFCNVGSLGRCSRTETNRTRRIQIVEVRGADEIERIELESALPAEDIFIENVPEGVDSDQIAAFVETLTDGLHFEQVGDVRAWMAENGVPDGIAAACLRYLEEAGL